MVRDEAILTSAGGIESPYQAPLPAGGYPPKPRGSPKGDAKKELLFDLECPEPPPAAVKELRCLGTGPLGRSKQCPANAADVGQIGVPPLEASPSGCREAYMTTMGDDGFLPAVLVLIHTLRKHTQVARDIVVYASTAVSAEAVALVRRALLLLRRDLGLELGDELVLGLDVGRVDLVELGPEGLGGRRANRVMVTRDGRHLSFAEAGDPAGFPVLCFFGVGSSRYLVLLFDDAARRLGLRVIACDRPGFGRSSPAAGRRRS